jgi:hypothetical protein
MKQSYESQIQILNKKLNQVEIIRYSHISVIKPLLIPANPSTPDFDDPILYKSECAQKLEKERFE